MVVFICHQNHVGVSVALTGHNQGSCESPGLSDRSKFRPALVRNHPVSFGWHPCHCPGISLTSPRATSTGIEVG